MAVETRNFFPQLQRHVTSTSSGSDVVSYISDLGGDGPILTLIHGYPQSAFIWRNVVPNLIGKVSLFVPEIPGYGISTPAKQNSRKDIGVALLEALQASFNTSVDAPPRRVILGGHDRGARISHRLAVNRTEFRSVTIVGAVLLDILPTKVQWELFANPAVSTAYFHWPLLAKKELAVPLLRSYGGGKWVRDSNLRLAGHKDRVEADNAVDVYAALFDKEETLVYTSEDYAYGAAPEVAEQRADQEAGRKLAVPTQVFFSQKGIGSTADVAQVWTEWILPGVDYEPVAVGDGAGHYLPEEAHEVVSEKILGFLQKHKWINA